MFNFYFPLYQILGALYIIWIFVTIPPDITKGLEYHCNKNQWWFFINMLIFVILLHIIWPIVFLWRIILVIINSFKS